MRPVHHRYVDPLAQIWLDCAARVGLRVVRSGDAYASSDGRGTLTIGDDASLDPDDSLAQMIFHELCHSLVQGEDAFARPDWGLDNETDRDAWREHACLRVQAVLAARHGLRRAQTPPWAPALGDALAATARVAAAVIPTVRPDPAAAPSLWTVAEPPPAPHPTGLPGALTDEPRACGDCAWRHRARGAERCRQAGGARIDPAWPGCERWEPALDCQTCGACCRAAYHAVEVARRDPVVARRPDYLVDLGTRLELRRAGDRCAALEGGEITGATTTRYACAIYDDRPRTCRDFTLGSEHCLTARRRVGLSP